MTASLVRLRPARPDHRVSRSEFDGDTPDHGGEAGVSLRVLWHRTVGTAVVLMVVTGLVALLANAYQRTLLVDTTSQVRVELMALMEVEEALEGFSTPAAGLLYGIETFPAEETHQVVFERVRQTVNGAFVELSVLLPESEVVPRAAATWVEIEQVVVDGPERLASGVITAALADNRDPYAHSVWQPLSQLQADVRSMRAATLRHFDAQTAAATRVQRMLTGSMAVVVAITAAVTWRATRRMHRAVVDPLLHLQDATHELGLTEGMRTVRLPGAVHELQQLAVTFNRSAVALEARREQLRLQAATDGLTGLLTRAAYLEAAQAMLEDPACHPAVVFVDLDDFKTINDTRGHAVGDEVLCAVAARISKTIREGDHAGRLGGDEFAVLIDCAARADAAVIVGRRLVGALRQPLLLPSGMVTPACSVGVAHASGHAAAEELLSHADPAMYAAKHGGKNRVAVHGRASDTVIRPELGPGA